ncbi:hypothetical protein BGZ72_010856 [Mortierella alpina]|nr:hypothetical protein BGZ72_010856 [Mortierella alpina]
MGSDWYTFSSTTAAAIPVPKDALQQPFDLPGFKLMTVHHEHYDKKRGLSYEYHGAMICLAETELCFVSFEVIGPYEIPKYESRCKRMKHLDAFMPADTREQLVGAFKKYTGREPEFEPGFWTMTCVAGEYYVGLHTTWSLGENDTIHDGSCDEFSFSVDKNYSDEVVNQD